jgi:hypothetical protein
MTAIQQKPAVVTLSTHSQATEPRSQSTRDAGSRSRCGHGPHVAPHPHAASMGNTPASRPGHDAQEVPSFPSVQGALIESHRLASTRGSCAKLGKRSELRSSQAHLRTEPPCCVDLDVCQPSDRASPFEARLPPPSTRTRRQRSSGLSQPCTRQRSRLHARSMPAGGLDGT